MPGGSVTTDFEAIVTEEISLPAFGRGPAGPLRLRFLARDFFQNNPFILPAFVDHVRSRLACQRGALPRWTAYCGSGLFALEAPPTDSIRRVAGVEISQTRASPSPARTAVANGITNADFHRRRRGGDLFAGLDFPAAETVVVIDPPRKGCDEGFLRQLLAFGPLAVVYVSCDPREPRCATCAASSPSRRYQPHPGAAIRSFPANAAPRVRDHAGEGSFKIEAASGRLPTPVIGHFPMFTVHCSTRSAIGQ